MNQTCSACTRWITRRVTVFKDGVEAVEFQASEGKGKCEALAIETPPEFGCNSFSAGDLHNIIERVDLESWRNWQMGPCPDCNGRGSPLEGTGCYRCVGTGKVRHYGDGYIGEERHRIHPKEKAERDASKILPPPVNPGETLQERRSDGILSSTGGALS